MQSFYSNNILQLNAEKLKYYTYLLFKIPNKKSGTAFLNKIQIHFCGVSKIKITNFVYY
jgi:hypothetical protein